MQDSGPGADKCGEKAASLTIYPPGAIESGVKFSLNLT